MPVSKIDAEELPGRADALRQLRELLDGNARLITVCGPAGVGKSQLCNRALAAPVQRPHCYYDIHDVDEPEDLVLAVTSANGQPIAAVDVAAAFSELGQGWSKGLRKQARCLVFFDGADGALQHVRAAIAGLLAQNGKLRFLVTARQPLNLPDEKILTLQHADDQKADDVAKIFDRLDDEEQATLRACTVFHGGIPSDAIGEIVDGAALERLIALKLLRAEKQTPDMFGSQRYFLSGAVRDVAAAQLLQRGERDAVASRHADYFYHAIDRLKERERLSEFLQDANNFLSAFRWIVKKVSESEKKELREKRYWFALHLLDVLRGYSLFDEDFGGEHSRCFLPATARLSIATVARKNAGPDLRRQSWAVEAYAEALAQAGRTEPSRKFAAQAKALRHRFDKQESLLREADVAMRKDNATKAESLLREALASCPRGAPQLLDIRYRLAKCLHAAGKLGEAEQLFRHIMRGKVASPRYPLDRALLLRDLGRHKRALALVQVAAAAADKANIRSLRVEAEGWSARITHELGQPAAAERAYREALGRCQYDGAQLQTIFRFQESDVADSHARFVEMSRIANGGYGNPSQAGAVLARLGALRIEQGRFAEAEEFLAEALLIQKKNKQPDAVAWSEVTLSCALIASERRMEAEPLLHRAIKTFRGDDLHARIARAAALGNLGNLYMDLGRLTEAREQYETALKTLEGTQQRSTEGVILISLGLLLQELGDPEKGREHLQRANTIFSEIFDGRGDPRWQGIAAIALGQFLHVQGDLEAAAAKYEQGFAFVVRQADRSSQARVLSYLGALEASRGMREQATQRFADAEKALAGTGDRLVAELLEVCSGFLRRAEPRTVSRTTPSSLEARVFLRMLEGDAAQRRK